MYIVIGNNPKKVELKDLNDCVYYKQQKVYTDAQYEGSVDLQRAIERKSLVVLKKSEDKLGSFDADVAIIPHEVKAPVSDSTLQINALLDRIQSLEQSIKNPETPQSYDLLNAVLERLERLEKNPATLDLSSIQDALKSIENRMQDTRSDAILDKIESILNRSGSGSVVTSKKEEATSQRVEEVYIPNVTVSDAKSNIKLEVRTIDTGDSVTDSLKKLKELRSKSK